MDILKRMNEVVQLATRHSSRGQSVVRLHHSRALRKYIDPPKSMPKRNTVALMIEWSDKTQAATVAAATPTPNAQTVIFDGMADLDKVSTEVAKALRAGEGAKA